MPNFSFARILGSNGKPLAEVRRGTRYFRGLALDATAPQADFGPTSVDSRLGMLCCGAVPYVQNYNIRLKTTDKCVRVRVGRESKTKR